MPLYIAPLFCCLQKQTAALWWADGGYSKEGADGWDFSDRWCILRLVLNQMQAATSPACRANEAGNLEFQSQLYSKAFDSFTKAIRLQPSSPVYHCNRAQAALKLGQYKTAILDSEWASQKSCAAALVCLTELVFTSVVHFAHAGMQYSVTQATRRLT